jgi:hypothetical protein
MNTENLFALSMLCQGYLFACAKHFAAEGKVMGPKFEAFAIENNVASVPDGMIAGFDSLEKGTSWTACFGGQWEETKAEILDLKGCPKAVETLFAQVEQGEVSDPEMVAEADAFLRQAMGSAQS